MVALIWLIGGVVLIATEVLSGDFVLLMLGLGALGAAGAGAIGANLVVTLVVFAAVSIGLITVARPALKRRMHAGDEVKTNVQALVGSKAVVVAQVDAVRGQVKIGGDTWSARAYDDTQVIEPGQMVTVMDISGATAVVWSES
ncbi:membrane protein implicated in regulation of membrane protease activity [Tamaricihabitans halophyticus]|uniref:Membrane protein implicated in regulation of membrane protease activity n=1 Tax=Tamaricihabitans halophyticus TaxID=1262583 RepID=A0A4V2STM3_9PSEU|nr:NfeD family protein [Tamaricihabitans halophyticus]TCP50906.1 membrane protein implicated in regulation of membrane protease activity [Tamaricihabitans halophyticus]